MENKKLLMIDDENPDMEDFSDALKKGGYAVDVASNASEAIQYLEQKLYDIVLLDIMMGHGDEIPASVPARRTGIEILGMIRAGKLRVNPDLPVVVLTALGTSREISDIRKAGSAEILQKPIQPDLLLITIDDLLTSYASEEKNDSSR